MMTLNNNHFCLLEFIGGISMSHLFIFCVFLSFLSLSLFADEECPNFPTGKKIEFYQCKIIKNESPVSSYAESVSILKIDKKTFNLFYTPIVGAASSNEYLIADGLWKQITEYNDYRSRVINCNNKKLTQIENFLMNGTQRYFKRTFSLLTSNRLLIEEDYGVVNFSGFKFENYGEMQVECQLKEG